jgi:hypothetical protein
MAGIVKWQDKNGNLLFETIPQKRLRGDPGQ